MTGTPQFIKPYPDIRAGDSQRTFLLARHGTTFTINGFNLRGVSRRNPLEFSRTRVFRFQERGAWRGRALGHASKGRFVVWVLCPTVASRKDTAPNSRPSVTPVPKTK